MGSPSTVDPLDVVDRAENGHVPVFTYSDDDVVSALHRTIVSDTTHSSKFDQLLFSRWDQAMRRGGVFRYGLDGVTTRVVDGRYGLVAQRNPKRFSHRRKPADMRTLTQPFDPTQFNFNKIRKDEILFTISKHGRGVIKGSAATSEDSEEEDPTHLIIVNVSPIDYGHILLIPNPAHCLPQVFTEDSIRLCLDVMVMSRRRGFCMVANSLLAYASVNHLHYHFMCVEEPMLAARVVGTPLAGSCFELSDNPCPGFGFELVNSTTAECAKEIYRVVALLLESDLPHNVVMLRGPPFSTQNRQGGATSNASTDDEVIRTLLVPRKPAYGLKNLYEGDGEVPPFFAAACELVLGLLPVVDQSKYPTLSEEEVLRILSDKALTAAEFEPLKGKVKQLLCH